MHISSENVFADLGSDQPRICHNSSLPAQDVAVLLGKTTATNHSAPQNSRQHEAEQAGVRVVKGLHASVSAVIEACVWTENAVQQFEQDQSAVDAFIRSLVTGRVLSVAEGRAGFGSPKLSKLRKIGRSADFLKNNHILPHLQPGYSILYQLVVLYEELPGDSDERFDLLVKILEQSEGDLSRDYLLAATKDAKRNKRVAVSSQSEFGRAPVFSAGKITTHTEVIEKCEAFDCLLLTPDSGAMRSLGENYAEDQMLSRCLRLNEVVAEDAVAVVIARVSYLPVVANSLLPLCGFGRLSHILLRDQPSEPDVIDAEVVIVAHRGRKQSIRLPDGFASVETDPVVIAQSLLPDANNRLHVFASGASEGWKSMVGDDCWLEKPSVR